MSKNENDQWIDDLLALCELPAPSKTLNKKIIKAIEKPKRQQNDSPERVLNIFVFRWRPALALASALILGICTGLITTPRSDIYANAAPVYMNSGLMLAQAILQEEETKND